MNNAGLVFSSTIETLRPESTIAVMDLLDVPEFPSTPLGWSFLLIAVIFFTRRECGRVSDRTALSEQRS